MGIAGLITGAAFLTGVIAYIDRDRTGPDQNGSSNTTDVQVQQFAFAITKSVVAPAEGTG